MRRSTWIIFIAAIMLAACSYLVRSEDQVSAAVCAEMNGVLVDTMTLGIVCVPDFLLDESV